MAYGSDAASKLESPVSGDKPKVEVKKLPPTEAPKSHQDARKDAINKAIKKAQAKNKDASTSKTEQTPAESE